MVLDYIDLQTFTLIHTALSLIALASGIIVMIGLVGSHTLPGLTALFLLTAVATSVTAFGFPFDHFLPSHWVAVLSLVALLFAILARYAFRYAGAWRWIYVIGIVLAVYFDAFVAVAQAFLKVPSFHAQAPTQSEPPFLIAQVFVMVLCLIIGVVAAKRFHRHTLAAA